MNRLLHTASNLSLQSTSSTSSKPHVLDHGPLSLPKDYKTVKRHMHKTPPDSLPSPTATEHQVRWFLYQLLTTESYAIAKHYPQWLLETCAFWQGEGSDLRAMSTAALEDMCPYKSGYAQIDKRMKVKDMPSPECRTLIGRAIARFAEREKLKREWLDTRLGDTGRYRFMAEQLGGLGELERFQVTRQVRMQRPMQRPTSSALSVRSMPCRLEGIPEYPASEVHWLQPQRSELGSNVASSSKTHGSTQPSRRNSSGGSENGQSISSLSDTRSRRDSWSSVSTISSAKTSPPEFPIENDKRKQLDGQTKFRRWSFSSKAVKKLVREDKCKTSKKHDENTNGNSEKTGLTSSDVVLEDTANKIGTDRLPPTNQSPVAPAQETRNPSSPARPRSMIYERPVLQVTHSSTIPSQDIPYPPPMQHSKENSISDSYYGPQQLSPSNRNTTNTFDPLPKPHNHFHPPRPQIRRLPTYTPSLPSTSNLTTHNQVQHFHRPRRTPEHLYNTDFITLEPKSYIPAETPQLALAPAPARPSPPRRYVANRQMVRPQSMLYPQPNIAAPRPASPGIRTGRVRGGSYFGGVVGEGRVIGNGRENGIGHGNGGGVGFVRGAMQDGTRYSTLCEQIEKKERLAGKR